MSNFEKEDRYLVIKRSDIDLSLDSEMKQNLFYLSQLVEAERHSFGKPPLECVVVESDWPIYDDVWKMVEAIATGEKTELDRLREENEALKRLDGLVIMNENGDTLDWEIDEGCVVIYDQQSEGIK
ncbi:hypothetical protein [Vibrio phage vB_VpM-pA2SJ1]|uniref:Uncharacterized protein n=1 Tax=Vibrio phage vB_VpM-pA2SJ1 TaxID=3095964 RepID=A0AAX4J5Y9_9CAUD